MLIIFAFARLRQITQSLITFIQAFTIFEAMFLYYF